jgi:holin-like protein
MIRGLFVLLLCQLVGEVVARGLGLPVPGPVLGLALLTAGLVVRSRWRPVSDDALMASDVGRVSTGLLGSLSLLFVPAGVGVVQYVGVFGQYGLALAVALVVSTFATLIATVGAFLLVKRLLGLNGAEGEA